MREGVCIIVYKDNPLQFLAIETSRTGIHSFVAGGIEKGESAIDAVKQELKEEVGLVPINIKDTGLDFTFDYKNAWFAKKGHQKVFLVKVANDAQVVLDKEVKAYRWLDKEGILEYIDNPVLKDIFKKTYAKFFGG